MRLFTALEVPDEVTARLDAALTDLRTRHRRLKWTPAHQWHLTVAFIGDVDVDPSAVSDEPPRGPVDGPLGSLTRVLAEAARQSPAEIRLATGAAGRFGKRVLWLGVEDDPADAVAALGGRAQQGLKDAGLPVDAKQVHPHLTLARSHRRSPPIDDALVAEVPAVGGTWSANELVLFRSVRQGRGQPNRYQPVVRLPLGPSR